MFGAMCDFLKNKVSDGKTENNVNSNSTLKAERKCHNVKKMITTSQVQNVALEENIRQWAFP